MPQLLQKAAVIVAVYGVLTLVFFSPHMAGITVSTSGAIGFSVAGPIPAILAGIVFTVACINDPKFAPAFALVAGVAATVVAGFGIFKLASAYSIVPATQAVLTVSATNAATLLIAVAVPLVITGMAVLMVLNLNSVQAFFNKAYNLICNLFGCRDNETTHQQTATSFVQRTLSISGKGSAVTTTPNLMVPSFASSRQDQSPLSTQVAQSFIGADGDDAKTRYPGFFV